MNIFAQDLVGRNTADPASAPGSSTDYIGRKDPLEPEDDEDLEALIDAEGEEASLTQTLRATRNVLQILLAPTSINSPSPCPEST